MYIKYLLISISYSSHINKRETEYFVYPEMLLDCYSQGRLYLISDLPLNLNTCKCYNTMILCVIFLKIWILGEKMIIWARAQQNRLNDLCAHRSLCTKQRLISLGVYPVWLVFIVHSKDSQGPKASSCVQRRLRLDWVFTGCTCQFVGFPLLQLFRAIV